MGAVGAGWEAEGEEGPEEATAAGAAARAYAGLMYFWAMAEVVSGKAEVEAATKAGVAAMPRAAGATRMSCWLAFHIPVRMWLGRVAEGDQPCRRPPASDTCVGRRKVFAALPHFYS